LEGRVSEKRVPWAQGRKALVRWAASDHQGAGDWFEAVARMHEDGHVEGPVTDADRCRIWFSEDLDNFVPDDDADTRPLPDHCGTCFLPFGCGCPGDGWSVPVHVRLPAVVVDVGLHLSAGAGFHGWESGGQWRVGGYERKPGATCRPVVPFRNGIAIYLKPWGQP
jgi:hypothetical protein